MNADVVEQQTRIEAGIRAVCEIAEAEKRRAGDQLSRERRVKVVGMPPPPPIDLFQGRDTELRRIAQYLQTPGVRIIAVVGGAGMGKTALARKVLNDLEEGRWPLEDTEPVTLGGIVYLSTRTAGISLERLYFDCAQVLGDDELEEELVALWGQKLTPREKVDRLLRAMEAEKTGSDKPMYIILLDNLEDKLDEPDGNITDPNIRDFFEALAHRESLGTARVLITSRVHLAEAYQDYSYHRRFDLNYGLELEEGIELLRQFDSQGTLGWRDSAEEQLRALVAVTNGTPRALELIASILTNRPQLTLADLNRLLEVEAEKRLEVLSLKNYDLLDHPARHVVEALAVFNRPVPVVAVDYLLQPFLPGANIPAVVERLRQMRAISYETADKASAAGALVSLHPLDQSLIYEQIPRDGTYHRGALEQQAAGYYAQIRLSRPWFRITHLEPQLLEFEHRLKGEDFAGALEVIDTIDYSRSNHHKYLAHMMLLGYGQDAIERRERLDLLLAGPTLKAGNLISLGWVCRRMGEKDKARQYFLAAVAEASKGTDKQVQVLALSELGYFLTDNDTNHDEAELKLSEALKLARDLGDHYAEAHVLVGLAFVEFQRSNNQASINHTLAARDLFHSIGASTPTDNHLAQYREIDCWTRLSMIYRKTMEYEKGIAVVHEGLKVAQTYDLKDWEAELYSQMGFHYRALGQHGLADTSLSANSRAIAYHLAALRLFQQQYGMKREEAVQHSYLGNLYSDLGQLDEALEYYDEAERIAVAVGLQRELSWILGNRGVLFTRMGNYDLALQDQLTGWERKPDQAAVSALSLVQRHKHRDSQVIRHTDIAATFLATQQYDEVHKHIGQALQIAAELQRVQIPSSLPAAYLQSPYMEDALPHEMQSPGDHQRRGLLLGCVYLHRGDFNHALEIIRHARNFDVMPHRHATAAVAGLICSRLGDDDQARSLFQQAIAYADELLQSNPGYYAAKYSRGLAYSGLVLLASEGDRKNYLGLAVKAYKSAFENCRARGVMADARHLFDELKALDSTNVLAPIERLFDTN